MSVSCKQLVVLYATFKFGSDPILCLSAIFVALKSAPKKKSRIELGLFVLSADSIDFPL